MRPGKQELRQLVDAVENAGRIMDDSQQDLQEAQAVAMGEEIAALKKLVLALAACVLETP